MAESADGTIVIRYGRESDDSTITSGPPDYYPYPPIASETHLSFLVSDRKRAGLGIGSALVQRAETEALAHGS